MICKSMIQVVRDDISNADTDKNWQVVASWDGLLSQEQVKSGWLSLTAFLEQQTAKKKKKKEKKIIDYCK